MLYFHFIVINVPLGFGHIEMGIIKEDCEWEVNTGDQKTWTRGKVVQFQHISTQGTVLSMSAVILEFDRM